MLLLAAAAHATYPSVELNIDAVDFIVDPNMEWQAQRPLNKISKLYAEVFGLQFRGTPRVVVNARAFDKKEAYEAFTRDVTGNVVPHSAGFYLQRPDGSEELVVWRYAENDKLTEVILHEASHKLLRLGPGAAFPLR